jgi:hypothetical protein
LSLHPFLPKDVTDAREAVLEAINQTIQITFTHVPQLFRQGMVHPGAAERLMQARSVPGVESQEIQLAIYKAVHTLLRRAIELLLVKYPRLHTCSPNLEPPHVVYALEETIRFGWEVGADALGVDIAVQNQLMAEGVYAETWTATMSGNSLAKNLRGCSPTLETTTYGERLNANESALVAGGDHHVIAVHIWPGASLTEATEALRRRWRDLPNEVIMEPRAGKPSPHRPPAYVRKMAIYQAWARWQCEHETTGRSATVQEFCQSVLDHKLDMDVLGSVWSAREFPSEESTVRRFLDGAREWLEPEAVPQDTTTSMPTTAT